MCFAIVRTYVHDSTAKFLKLCTTSDACKNNNTGKAPPSQTLLRVLLHICMCAKDAQCLNCRCMSIPLLGRWRVRLDICRSSRSWLACTCHENTRARVSRRARAARAGRYAFPHALLPDRAFRSSLRQPLHVRTLVLCRLG